MSDTLKREFMTQMGTLMDSVLKRTTFEIMKIFENSLHDHQMELAHKGEEIAQLKLKLQRAEIRLRENERGGARGAEMNMTQMNETQREPEDVLNIHGQASDVPEIDFEVPDDWCAPLGSETMTKQGNDGCPSIRLRSLYIPLYPIPLIKQEAIHCDNETKGVKISKTRSSLRKGPKPTQVRSLPMCNEGTRLPRVKGEMKMLLRDLKYEDNVLTRGTSHRRTGRNLNGKEQENTLKSKSEERNISATECESMKQETVGNNGKEKPTCKFCRKVFDTEFGLSVHLQWHKRCRACNKDFRFPRSLKCHQQFCEKLKKLLEKEAQSTDPPERQSCDEEETTTPSKKRLINKKESTPSSSKHSEPSVKKHGATKRHSCVYCNKTFLSHCRLEDHVRVHTGEKPFSCSMCPKKFRINQSLKMHTIRIHKDQVNSIGVNGDLAWTKPLEMTEDNQEDLISPRKDTSQAITHKKVKKKYNPYVKPRPRWQTMGTKCKTGYSCLLCQKILRNKYLLIEHFLTHTGGKSMKCDQCPVKFSSLRQLAIHKKNSHSTIIQCKKCKRKFPSQTRYSAHLSLC
ncbi:oocyte zinc finger protein XlCOF28-like isoform X2 [Pempheris klunzingeri]|uniref:oocyte zinc finger protein XlCOF28-like isoform X2 n=1 Tax=Pempheris klunzingeri TaxID=3127111 RepID=UPI003980859A